MICRTARLALERNSADLLSISQNRTRKGRALELPRFVFTLQSMSHLEILGPSVSDQVPN